jgi:hypothetical protein
MNRDGARHDECSGGVRFCVVIVIFPEIFLWLVGLRLLLGM